MKTIILILSTCLYTVSCFSQNFSISGTVTDGQFNPVANHPLYIISNSSSFIYYNTVYTDASGTYSDIIINGAQPGQNIVFEVWIDNNCSYWHSDSISNNQGTINSGVINFQICHNSQSCNANFYYFDSQNNGTVNFTSTSNGNGLTYHWSFGNFNFSNAQNPTFSFAPGTHFVSLTITGNNCNDYHGQYITVGNNCNANFYTSIDTLNNAVYLTDYSVGNSNLNYSWDFGDGNSSALQFPTHTYPSYGIYEICLTVDDGLGCSSTYCDSVGFFQFHSTNDNRSSGFTINVIPASSVGVDEVVEVLTDMNVYPNPANENAALEYNATEGGNHSIILTDITGKIVMNENYNAQKGNNRLNLNLNSIESGMYLITIADTNGNQTTLRITKQ